VDIVGIGGLADAPLDGLAGDTGAGDTSKETSLGSPEVIPIEIGGAVILDHVDFDEHGSVLGVGIGWVGEIEGSPTRTDGLVGILGFAIPVREVVGELNPIQLGGREVHDSAERPGEVGFDVSERGIEDGIEAEAETLSGQIRPRFAATEEGGELAEVASVVGNGSGGVELGDEPTDFPRRYSGVALPERPPESGEEIEAGEGAVERLSGERADLGEGAWGEFREVLDEAISRGHCDSPWICRARRQRNG
jgi:hypothetical protein